MDYFSIWHWLIVGAILVLVFGGRGKISELMGDAAKGIKAFKKGMAEEDSTGGVASKADPSMRSNDYQKPADEPRPKTEDKF
jgi:sec-independent protein translocase protein TatA